MTDSRSITEIFILAAILIIATWLGISIVTDQIITLLYVSAGGALISCALLGPRIWMILPFAAALNITVRIPGQPNTLLIAHALFVGFCLLQLAIRRLSFKIQITELEIWVIILVLCVVQAYIRNPVGLQIFGSSTVGARPYAIFLITLASCLILCTLRVNSQDLHWILRLGIIAGIMNMVICTVGFFIPKIGMWLASGDLKASSVNNEETSILQGGQYGIERATRIDFIGYAGRNIALWISSFKDPIRACFHPLWAPFLLISLTFAALSGFRSEIAAVGLTYLVGIAYRGGIVSVFIAIMTLIISIAMLALLNLAVPLPKNIQRSLSFLPGTWDEIHIAESKDSTQWRVDMWEAALLTDHWIQNKILGDGLGMTRKEFDFITSFDSQDIGGYVGTGKLTKQQEFLMASNNYHSGPVSSIRAIGYLGLILFMVAQIRLAVHAHRQIKRAKNTPWLPLTLFVGIPIIWFPISFYLIYGEIGPAIASFLIGASMMRLLQNNLPLPIYKRNRESQVKITSMVTSKI